MDAKALKTLEYEKVLARLEAHCSFAPSAEMARALHPSTALDVVQQALNETAEGRRLLADQPQFSIGGARDVREALDNAGRGQVLAASELLDTKSTLVAARTLARRFEDEEGNLPLLTVVAQRLPQQTGVIDAVTKAISSRGEVLDSASDKLGSIRSELAVVHDRLLDRMQKLLTSNQFSKHVQEAIVTQREGRYVLPIRADAKGRVKAVVHDQSSSGATLFVEPLQVVEMNNRWRELQLAERDEEQRILRDLSALVGEKADEILAAIEGLAQFDFALARARYAGELDATQPEIKEMRPRKDGLHPGVVIKLLGARHPLLDPANVVALDVELHPENYCLVITGPNTGGKTVTLKTVGLLALMAQSGLHIPAEAGSQISLFQEVFADIGDEQSIEQSLSTFSGHITKIVDILERADQSSLVILDELGAGTDPQEGAALANALLDHLVRRGITTLVATHYPELKAYAHGTPGVVNASVEFDLETLAPTYHLTIGLPGRSNALAIAKRLGLNDEVIEAARGSIDPAELKAEDLLNEIHREKDRTREARSRAEQAQKDAQATRAELAERLEKIEDERLEILESARQEAQADLRELNEELRKLRAKLARARQPLDEVQQVGAAAEELAETVEQPHVRQDVPESAPDRPLRLGDSVRVRSLDRAGILTALGEADAEVQVGALRVRARLGDLELLAVDLSVVEEEPEAVRVSARVASPGGEISLRGQRVEEALTNLDRYLDQAYASGLPFARVIHGKGTGKLRQVVREELGRRDYVERFETAMDHEGGEGVTVVFFRED